MLLSKDFDNLVKYSQNNEYTKAKDYIICAIYVHDLGLDFVKSLIKSYYKFIYTYTHIYMFSLIGYASRIFRAPGFNACRKISLEGKEIDNFSVRNKGLNTNFGTQKIYPLYTTMNLKINELRISNLSPLKQKK